MLKNYIKIAFRNFKRQSGYSLITLSGLALGIACCLLIVLYIRYELSYDRFHTDADRLYRIVMDATIGPTTITVPITNNPLSPTLVRDFPEVIASTRIRKISKVLVMYGDNQFYESGALFADGSIFDVLSFPFIKGEAIHALDRSSTVVLTESLAAKYFGGTDPIGKVLRLDSASDFEVTGVIKDVPRNSHIDFDMLVSFESLLADQPYARDDWISAHNFTYLRLRDNAEPRELEAKFPAMIEKYMSQSLKALGGSVSYSLQPVTDIRLHSKLQFEFSPNGNIHYIYLFTAIALFILGIACINFMNLATARSTKQAREVGIRKVTGALRRDLIRQFLGESTFYSLLALIISLALVQMALPVIRSMSGIDLHIGTTELAWLFPLLIGLVLFTGVAAGSYPAFFLSAYQPFQVLQGSWKTGYKSPRFRHILVVLQFVVSIALIIGTWVIRNQIQYMKSEDLGFTKEQVLVSQVDNLNVLLDIETLKGRLRQVPGVIEVAGADAVPGQGPMATTVGVIPEGFTQEQGFLMKAIRADEDYIAALGMELVAGRNFSEELTTDKQGVFLLNEAAAQQFGWDAPVGRTIKIQGLGQGGGRGSRDRDCQEFSLRFFEGRNRTDLYRRRNGRT